MNKQQLEALGKVWEREVTSALSGGIDVFQSRSKLFRKLADDGYLEQVTRTLSDRFGVMRVTGYVLTHAGRFTYCATCTTDEATENEQPA